MSVSLVQASGTLALLSKSNLFMPPSAAPHMRWMSRDDNGTALTGRVDEFGQIDILINNAIMILRAPTGAFA